MLPLLINPLNKTCAYNVTLIDRKVLSSIYPAMNPSFLLLQLCVIKVNHLSGSLRTRTVLCCLIIQVLNIKSLFPKCLIQSLSLLYTVI